MGSINYIFILMIPSLMLWIVYRAWIAAKDFQKMPTFREYVKNFPGSGGKGAKCYKCNYNTIRIINSCYPQIPQVCGIAFIALRSFTT